MNMILKGIMGKLDKFFRENGDSVTENEVNAYLKKIDIKYSILFKNGHLEVIREE